MNMYDKLGDLLNETLEAGAVKFIRLEKNDGDKTEENSVLKSDKDQNQSEIPKKKVNSYVYKKLSPELEHAYKVLDLDLTANKDDLKKAYKEKLLYYHPDKHTGNSFVEKVATKKTSEIILSYNLIDEFLSS